MTCPTSTICQVLLDFYTGCAVSDLAGIRDFQAVAGSWLTSRTGHYLFYFFGKGGEAGGLSSEQDMRLYPKYS